MHHTPLIATLVAGLVLAFVFGALAHRLRVSPLIGYLLAGVAVGPFTPGFVADQGLANELAEIGVTAETFKAGDKFAEPDLVMSAATFSYADGDGFHFMDQTSFETLTLGTDIMGADRGLLVDNVEVQIHRYNGQPIGIIFPPHVELIVASTEMGVRGNTASGSVTKPAVLETGMEIQVPLFIKEGEKVKVHTETREFAGRA